MRAALAAPLAACLAIALQANPIPEHARQSSPALPRVTAAALPQYPRDAAKAGTAGIVLINVTADGHKVREARLLQSPSSSPSPFAEAALRNIHTWRFAASAPATFDVTYRFTIVERPCDSLGRDTHTAAVIHFPSEVEIFAERDARCNDARALAPVFGIYVREATIPFFPDAARANGIEGTVKIGVTYKGVLSIAEGPSELGEPLIDWIREWTLVPGPYSEEMKFKFTLVDGDCRGGGPIVTVGPGLTSYEITDKRVVPCADGPARLATSSR